jgi:hypothetical protein
MKKIIGIIMSVFLVVAVSITIYMVTEKQIFKKEKPEELIVKYMKYIEKKEYDAMYSMIETNSQNSLTKENFINRNSKIYEGMEVRNLKVDSVKLENHESKNVTVSYNTSFETIAGKVSFRNKAIFTNTEDGYKMLWDDSLIFPELEETDKIQVSTMQAERGEITDRNGKVLAGKGIASSVGIVPGKLKDRDDSFKKLAKLLNIDAKTIKSKLGAKWVKDDSFVPITTIPKVSEQDLMKLEPDNEVLKEQKRQEKLLDISGVMLSDTEVRSYTLGEAASHLIGYVQSVTAEDLEKHQGEGYSSNSVIGRSGIEGLFEKELKGQDGYEICIVDEEGKSKKTIAEITEEDGEDIQLTIDSDLQKSLYEQFKKDKGCSVAMNPYTGEVLALVSTPSYDNNDFIRGMSSKQWTLLNEDKDKPLYNRFRQVWCPGSTFKPVIASIGLKTGAFDADEDFENEGLSWQKDSSWGSYYVTTLHAYEPVTMKNALIYSDNIYFAKAALKIGADKLAKSLDEIGFNQELPFDIIMSNSQYSNTDKIETEVQLADSGYGQGQVLVNPLHLASIYTAFVNEGNIVKPYLQYKENTSGEIWIPKVFSTDTVNKVMEGLKGVVNDSHGTARSAYRKDIMLAGKTGTAELKATKEDTEGTEIGWFSVFTVDKDVKKPVLIISMVENVKGIGGSGYVVNKDKAVIDEYMK